MMKIRPRSVGVCCIAVTGGYHSCRGNSSLWSVILCSLVNSHQCLGGGCGPHLHGPSSPRIDNTPEDLNIQNIMRT